MTRPNSANNSVSIVTVQSAVSCPTLGSQKLTSQHTISRKKGKEGIATAWTAIITLVLVMFIGLVVDTGYIVLTKQQLQTVADASALAGAYTIKTSEDQFDSRANAVTLALLNTAASMYINLGTNSDNATNGDIVIGRFDFNTDTITPTNVYPNAIQINARRTEDSLNDPLTLIFGDILGTASSNVSATAVAMVQGGFGAGVIALNPTEPCAFDLRGTPSLFQVTDGVIYINSSNSEAMCHSGQPTVDTGEIYVVGGTDRNYEQVDFLGDLIFTDDVIADPLADLPAPAYDVDDDLGEITAGNGEELTFGPGYYSDGLVLNNNGGIVNLTPGVYILDGEGLNATGGTINAEGCIFYIVDSKPNGMPQSKIDITGNPTVNMSEPDPDNYTYPEFPDITPYADGGVTIFQARDNTHDSRIVGTANFNLGGTIYMPNNHIIVGGSSANFANALIADTIEVHGNGLMSINYNGQYGDIPPTVFLVL